MRKSLTVIILLAGILLLVFGCKFLIDNEPGFLDELLPWRASKQTPNSSEDGKSIYGPYELIRVIDGDTLLVEIDGAETRVRLIGVDTPESVNPDESQNTPEGKTASEYMKALLSEQNSVYLEYDIQREDDYGRTLAYVYLDMGDTMLQEALLEAGMATTMTIQPNSKYATRFYSVMTEARDNNAGFWKTGFFTD